MVPGKRFLWRVAAAAAKASVHSSARMWSAIEKPISPRVQQSRTEATQTQPSSVGT